MAISMIHDHGPAMNCPACYNSEPYQFGGLSVPERMVMDYYEANWELGAMHCSGEDFDDEAQA